MSTLSPVPQRLELAVQGMTCASCAARIERRLNRLEGVEATVNYALERAMVTYDPDRVQPDQLLEAVEQAGYHARLPGRTEAGQAETAVHSQELKALRQRTVVALALAIPVMAISTVPALQFDFWQWIVLLLATPVILWAGWPFHRAAWQNLRHGTATMDTLVSIGTLAAWGWSIVVMFVTDAGDPSMRMGFDLVPARGESLHHVYFEVGAIVTAFILLGRYLEARARRRAGAALRALLELGAKEATVVQADGSERRIPVDQLLAGDRFVVRPGERIATDGLVEQGASAVDESLLTGESVPVDKADGHEVFGATLNIGGRLVVRATRVGADTALAQIAKLVSDAQTGKAPIQRLADRVSAVFVPVVLIVAVATLAFWLRMGEGYDFALTAMVAVLIIACPCALGLATPTAIMVGTGRGAELGLLIKGPEVLESTRRVDTVVLDKTGTITAGKMALLEVHVADGIDPHQALRLVGALEDASEHPIARAIAHAARERAGVLPDVDGFINREGLGVEGIVEGRALLVGRPALLADRGLQLPETLEHARRTAEAQGRTVVAAAWDGTPMAIFAVADTPKPSSRTAISRLRDLGLRPILLTGDNATTARAVAAEVGIDEVIAEVLPADKADVVRRLQNEGLVVAMVGDGVNDAPALAQADLGLAIGTGTDVAIEASDLTLVSGDLNAAADAIRLSRRTLRTIKSNLFWAFAYNVVLIPAAAAGFLNPVLAGAAMALSSVFVVSNSLRLRRFSAVRIGGGRPKLTEAPRTPAGHG